MDNLLYFAISTKNTELVRMHLERGISPNEPYRDGRSALMIAADRDSESIFRLLLDNNASTSGCDSEGRTLSERLTQLGQIKYLHLLQEYLNQQSSQSEDGEVWDEDEDDFADLLTSDWELITQAESNTERDFRDEVIEQSGFVPDFHEEYTDTEEELFEILEDVEIPQFQDFPVFTEAETEQFRRFYTFATSSNVVPDSMIYDLCDDLCLYDYYPSMIAELLSDLGISVTSEDPEEILDWFRDEYSRWSGSEEDSEGFESFMKLLEEEVRFCSADCLYQLPPEKTKASSREIMESIKTNVRDLWSFICSDYFLFVRTCDSLRQFYQEYLNNLTFEQRKYVQELFQRLFDYRQSGDTLKNHQRAAENLLFKLANNLEIVNRILHDLLNYCRWDPVEKRACLSFLDARFEEIQEQTTDVIFALTKTVRSQIRKFEEYFPEDMEDILQTALMGVVKGVLHYNFTINTHIQAYISFWIFQRIQRSFADEKMFIRLPAHIPKPSNDENQIRIKTDSFNLYFLPEEKNREPSFESMNSGELEKWCIDNRVIYYEDLTCRNYKDLYQSFRNVFKYLLKRQRNVLTLRYGLGGKEALTLEQIATRWGVTRERIRQIEKNAIKLLRNLASNLPSKDLITMMEFCDDE